MAKNYTGRNEIEKDFIRTFEAICYRHNPWSVWRDFINMTACSIANAVDRTPERWKPREDSYMATVKGYTPEELDSFARLFAKTVEALEQNPRQDFLGNLYMNLNFGSDWSGQFFTPWHVAEMMARITLSGKQKEDLENRGYISVSDPACGAGCMLLAFIAACQDEKFVENYQAQVLFVGQDLDKVVAQMCYIQISLLGCAGYVVVGNTLTQPVTGSTLFPQAAEGCEIWYTPMFLMEPWEMRRECELFKRLIELL